MRFYPRKYLVFIFDGDSTGAHHFQHAKPNLCLEYRAPDTLCFLQCVGRCNGAVDILQLREQGLNRVGVDHLGTSGVSFAPLLLYVVPTHLMFIRPRATPRSGRARMTPLLALLCAVVLARLLSLRVRRRISLPTVIAYRRVIARRTVICNRRSIAPATVISSETVNRSAPPSISPTVDISATVIETDGESPYPLLNLDGLRPCTVSFTFARVPPTGGRVDQPPEGASWPGWGQLYCARRNCWWFGGKF